MFALMLCGCGPKTEAETPTDEPAPGSDEPGPKTAGDRDAPEISRSLGEKGGIVVFWPRVIPRSGDPEIKALAGKLQERLRDIAGKNGGTVDVRPEPERVCPEDGCNASTLGALLVHKDGGCTVLGLVSGSGQAPVRIIPWAGLVKLKKDSVPFRDLPENEVTVRDAVPCKDLIDKLGEKEADVAAALKETAASP
jgi:hypothetical protein